MLAHQQWPNPVPPWPDDFPDVVGQCSLESLYSAAFDAHESIAHRTSSAYRMAKAGDVKAAVKVVSAIIDIETVTEIHNAFPGSVVASVHAEEEQGRNKLALAYANALGDICDFEVDGDIVQCNRANHTNASARQRMARVPLFDGEVISDRQYIVVDDVCTTGSSLAALRHYIEARGSRVVLATALAVPEPKHGHDARRLPITSITIEKIRKKFDSSAIDVILYDYGVAPSIQHLTEAAGQTILGFETAYGIRSSLLAAR